MFCIAAYIVFGILAIFSASFRPLAAKAWHCVLRRITLRPCDINFSEELKGKIIGKALKHSPALARFLERWIDWFAAAFVILSIWSLVSVLVSSLNLFVYDTCNPLAVESCSLGGEACGVQQQVPGFVESWKSGTLVQWTTGPFTRFAKTVSLIPNRVRTWKAEDYLAPTATFSGSTVPGAPVALEVMDPLCQFCKKLLGNIRSAGVDQQYRVSYLLYPIPNPSTPTGTKFAYSGLIALYLEAAKEVQPGADWDLLEKLFSDRPDGIDWQTYLRIGATEEDVRRTMRQFFTELGVDASRVEALILAPRISDSLAEQKQIVEQKLRTIKIPTFLMGGKRFDRVVSTEKLRSLLPR